MYDEHWSTYLATKFGIFSHFLGHYWGFLIHHLMKTKKMRTKIMKKKILIDLSKSLVYYRCLNEVHTQIIKDRDEILLVCQNNTIYKKCYCNLRNLTTNWELTIVLFWFSKSHYTLPSKSLGTTCFIVFVFCA